MKKRQINVSRRVKETAVTGRDKHGQMHAATMSCRVRTLNKKRTELRRGGGR